MAKKTTNRKKTNTKPAVQAAPKPAEAPIEPEVTETPEVTPTAVETPGIGLKQLLLVYNSLARSRRRWIRNRNQLRNDWKELFIILEQASGRTGQKADLFDMNWHQQVEKDGIPSLADKPSEDVTIVAEAPASPAELLAEVDQLKAALADALDTIEKLTIDKTAPDVTEEVTDETTTAEEEGKTPQAETTTPSAE